MNINSYSITRHKDAYKCKSKDTGLAVIGSGSSPYSALKDFIEKKSELFSESESEEKKLFIKKHIEDVLKYRNIDVQATKINGRIMTVVFIADTGKIKREDLNIWDIMLSKK